MKKQNFSAYFSLLALPGVLCLMGVVLLLNPDSATTLLSKLLGWVVFLLGLGVGIYAIARREATAVKILCALACMSVGSWLIRHPLALAAAGGLAVGVLLILRGIQEFKENRLWAVVIVALGALLVLLPLATSRLVFSLCGLVMLAAGVLMGCVRLRRGRLDSGDDDPNIIDAL